jgi:hypothetical protein
MGLFQSNPVRKEIPIPMPELEFMGRRLPMDKLEIEGPLVPPLRPIAEVIENERAQVLSIEEGDK